MISVLAVVGPTASGKTSLAIDLAERLDTEIVSADSMQVYRGMEIGTGAPSPEELGRVRQHFVGILEPFEPFSAGEFQRRARDLVRTLNERGKTAVVAGGAGLYIRALLDGLFPGPARDEATRERLHAEAEQHGVAALFERLQELDPDYARIIHDGDLRRIVRALEIHEVTGQSISCLHREHRAEAQPLDSVQVALDYPRAELYKRINTRVDAMVEAGLLEEVRALVEHGFENELRRLRSLGYREMLGHLQGKCSLEDAVEATKQNTRRFAKRQLSWFRADSRVHWLPATASTPTQRLADKALSLLQDTPM